MKHSVVANSDENQSSLLAATEHGRKMAMGFFKSHDEEHKEAVENAHNQGQTDASNGIHRTPYGIPLFSPLSMPETDEINEAYEKGHQHAKSQK